MTHTMADGCCSARKPCWHQCDDPTTICDLCREASMSVADWLAEQAKIARKEAAQFDVHSASEQWSLARAVAFEAAHAYASARPDRSQVTELVTSPSAAVADADLAYLAGLAISSKDAALARIAAALLLAR